MARRNQIVNPSTHPFSVKAHGQEAGNMVEFEDADGNVNFAVDADGNITAVGSIDPAIEVASADGAIAATEGLVIITKGTAAALTLAAPTDVTDDGKILTIVSTTAAAHTVTQTDPGFNAGGGSEDVATYGAAKGNAMTIIAYGAVWHATNLTGVTLA